MRPAWPLTSVYRRVVMRLARRPWPFAPTGPCVSFTFDDFARSAAAVAAPILSENGGRGTFYASMGLTNRRTEIGDLFTAGDLEYLASSGHEVASHTYSHRSAWDVSLASFDADVRKGCKLIHEVLGSCASANFAYPYGEATVSAKAVVGGHRLSCRGTDPGINDRLTVDLNLLRANPLYGPGDLDRLRKLFAANAARKGWLIFYTHDVCPSPSTYGCSPRLLQKALRLASQYATPIQTVGSVLENAVSCPDEAALPIV